MLIDRPHSFLTLRLGDNLTRVLHNNLVGLKGAVAPNTVPTIRRLDDFHADVVLASSLGPLLELLETAVTALLTHSAITFITLVEHVAVLTLLVAARFWRAHALGQFTVLVCPPYTGRLSHKDVYRLC